MNIEEIKRVFESVGLTVIEDVTPSGSFMGYRVADSVTGEMSGHRSLRSLGREAKKLSKGLG